MKEQPFRTIFSALVIFLFLIKNFTSQANTEYLWLTLFNPHDSYDETMIAFTADATDSVDFPYDFPKSRDSSAVLLYSWINTGAFAIQGLPPLTDDRTVTLGIDALFSGMYLLRLANAENLDASVSVILEDTVSGTSINLRTAEYRFDLDAGRGIHRLRLHFNPAIDITTIDGNCDGTPSLLQVNQRGSFSWDYEIRNESGDLLDAVTSFNGMRSYPEIPTGTYTITLADPYGYTVVKSFSIIDKEAVVAQFQVSDSITFVNQPVYFFDYSVGAFDYFWSFGDGDTLTGSPYPIKTFSQPGTYNVQFSASNNECTDISAKMIKVKDVTSGISTGSETELPVIYSYGNEVFIEWLAPQKGTVRLEIFNMLGQKITDEPLGLKEKVSFVTDCGICLVRISGNNKKFDKKVFLK